MSSASDLIKRANKALGFDPDDNPRRLVQHTIAELSHGGFKKTIEGPPVRFLERAEKVMHEYSPRVTVMPKGYSVRTQSASIIGAVSINVKFFVEDLPVAKKDLIGSQFYKEVPVKLGNILQDHLPGPIRHKSTARTGYFESGETIWTFYLTFNLILPRSLTW